MILFGEHFVVHGTKAILCAINKRVFVTAQTTNERDITIKSDIGDLILERGTSIEKIDLPLRPFYFLADRLLEEQSKVNGIKVSIKSEIPVGVGLGSSSACCVAGAGAISGLFSNRTREEILELAIDAEKTTFKDTSGADCTVSAHGGMMIYDKTGFARIESGPNFQLVISNSGIEHSTQKIVAKVQRFKDENKDRFSELCSRESKLVEEVLDAFRDDGKITELGKRVTENQEFLETIGVSNDRLGKMIETGNRSSYGSKITGAGGGGCIFSLTDEENAERTLSEFKSKNYECFLAKIDHKGLDTF